MAKTRTVIVTLELETDASLIELRDKYTWAALTGNGHWQKATTHMGVRQVTATVAQSPKVQPPKPGKGVKG